MNTNTPVTGITAAHDALDAERKIVYASQVVDIQFAHLRPWLEYRKATADKLLVLPKSYSYEEIRKSLEDLLAQTNLEITKLMGL
jgi:hypothetical protein